VWDVGLRGEDRPECKEKALLPRLVVRRARVDLSSTICIANIM
jgi:hypothetical protein